MLTPKIIIRIKEDEEQALGTKEMKWRLSSLKLGEIWLSLKVSSTQKMD